jgi:2-amino-4-hydroxy-6-hydroxymethyldihydropteridine diphosphokinase/dihydropteroate synthase
MIILGLGTNLQDRLNNLRRALKAIHAIPSLTVQQVSPVYLSDALLPENAPADWNMSYLNLAIRCEATCTPDELLAHIKKIEKDIGRETTTKHWGPRIIDIDILAWDDLVLQSEVLSIPRESLLERPFQLWPLADVAPAWIYPLKGAMQGKSAAEIVESWGSRFSGTAPLHTRQIYQRIDTPCLVGIINVTPDSFSDGGQFFNVEHALQQAQSLVDGGAEIIDIGAESTAPNAEPVDAETEWARLKPVLLALQAEKKRFLIPPKISVDTRHATIAAKALALGVDWINDVTGFQDPAMREIVLPTTSDCVIMHHVSIPADRANVLPRHQDPVKFIYDWSAKRLDELEKLGFARERLIIDPGIGFGKVAEHSLLLIKHIAQFQSLGVRILVGHSRKSFLSLFTSHAFSERDIETLAVSFYLAKQGVDYLRVHNVEMCARGMRMMAAL